jgi:hypothetical protein
MSDAGIEIVPDDPQADGLAAGRKIGKAGLLKRTAVLLGGKHLCETLGAMSRRALARYVKARLHTPPDYGKFPELQDIYPERLDRLRGFAAGAECSLDDAAVYQYLAYRENIDHWYNSYQLCRSPGHCSGVLLIGPDGVLGAHRVESGPPPRPKGCQNRYPKPAGPIRSRAATTRKLVLKRPRTGYISNWGTTNEKGVGAACGTSCSVWLDEPIEDAWPVNDFPLLRFARDVDHLTELYQRYTLHVWGRASQIWADVSGNAVVIEKSYRRIGVRRLNGAHVLWCTEGHFESDEMNAYMRQKRLEYIASAGKHLGAEDMQYATDCHVRFTHLGELCHQNWGRGLKHMQKILTDHAPFPRAVCRHGGPDTAPYDTTVTLHSVIHDFTRNRQRVRKWVPWKKFCCQVHEEVIQYPPRP